VKRQPQADQKAFRTFQQKILKFKNLVWVADLQEFQERYQEDIQKACELTEEEEEEDDSADWDSEDEESSEESDDELAGLSKEQRMRRREFWVKKTETKKKVTGTKAKPKSKKKTKEIEQKKGSQEQDNVWNEKRVRKQLTILSKQKPNLDRQERRKTIESLKKLEPHCTRPQWRLLTKRLVIEHLLRMYTSPSIMKSPDWKELNEQIASFVVLLTEYPEYRVHDLGSLTIELTKEERKKMKELEVQKVDRKGVFTQGALNAVTSAGLGDAEKMLGKYQENLEDLEDELPEGLDPSFKWMQGNLINFVNHLASELRLSLKRIKDPNAEEYIDRLNDHKSLIKTATVLLGYFANVIKHKFYELKIRGFLLGLTFEQYNKDYDLLGKPKEEQKYKPFCMGDETPVLVNIQAIFKMCKLYDVKDYGGKTEEEVKLFEDIIVKIRFESILRTVHYIALHHRYLLARDILTSSGVSRDALIVRCEVNTQILYNRTVARLAIAAFTHGDWRRAMDICKDLYTTGKHKELLAQGIKSDLRWKNNKTPEDLKQEQEEKGRMVPDHAFINPDLLESVHFIASLFFEIKAILTNREHNKTIEYNKSFRKQWNYRAKREFLAPPENNRDKIMEAGDQMMKGNWKECEELLESLKCWNIFEYVDQVKEKVFKRAREECLRCYLISSSKHFSDIELDTLAIKFELDRIDVIQLCSRFISDGDFKASIDLQGGYLIIHESLNTQFVNNAFQYQEKLTQFMGSIRDIADSMGVQRDFRGKRNYRNKDGNNRNNQKKNTQGGSKRWSRF